MKAKNEYNPLCQAIETKLDRQMRTPKDFDYLSEQIFQKLHQNISPTTLKRLWGYLHSEAQPRQSTLDLLAQFIDYQDIADFYSQESMTGQEGNTPAGNKGLYTYTPPPYTFFRNHRCTSPPLFPPSWRMALCRNSSRRCCNNFLVKSA